MRRGQADEDHGVDGGVMQRRGTGAAAEVAGELRVVAALLHKKRKGEASEKRQGAGNIEEESEGRRDVGGNRNEAETVAERRAPASNGGGLGARFECGCWGKRRGGRGLLIGVDKERNHGFNRRIGGRRKISGESRDLWRKEEEGDVTACVTFR